MVLSPVDVSLNGNTFSAILHDQEQKALPSHRDLTLSPLDHFNTLYRKPNGQNYLVFPNLKMMSSGVEAVFLLEKWQYSLEPGNRTKSTNF